MSPRFRLKFLEDGKDLQKVISKKWYPITTWSIDLTYKFLKLKTNTLYFTWICWNYHQFVWEHVGCRTSAVLGMRPFWRKVPVFLPCNFNTWFHSCTDVAADLHEFRGTSWCFTDRHHPGRKTSLAEEWIPSKQQTSKRNMYPLENFNLPLPFRTGLTGMVQSYTFIPSHNILIPLAIGSFHRLQRMVTKRVSSWRVAHLYLISYMFPKVKEGFSRIYIKFLKGKCPKVCGGCSVLCQLHDNLSMCRGSFLNLTCCQAQIKTTKKYRKTSSSMYNILSSTQNNIKI